jgi:exodeoxyribonuclease VIII
MKPGIYHDISNADYHATTAINASFLKSWVLYSPFHAKYGKNDISKLVADLGTATHSMALEPDKKLVEMSTEKTRATKAYKEHEARCIEEGKVLLTQKDFEMVQGLVNGVETDDGEIVGGLMGDPHCKKLLTEKDRVCEASIFVNDPGTGQLKKARIDIFSEKLGMMGDVKTCQDASPRKFGREIFMRGYHLQAAHYLICAEEHGLEIRNWGFLAVSKTWPYPAHFHMLDDYVLDYSKQICRAAYEEMQRAEEAGVYDTRWPSFSTHELPEYLDN